MKSNNDALSKATKPTTISAGMTSCVSKRDENDVSAESFPHALQRAGVNSLDMSFPKAPIPGCSQ